MPLPTQEKISTKHAVTIYLLVGIGLIVGVVVGIAYLFTGPQ